MVSGIDVKYEIKDVTMVGHIEQRRYSSTRPHPGIDWDTLHSEVTVVIAGVGEEVITSRLCQKVGGQLLTACASPFLTH